MTKARPGVTILNDSGSEENVPDSNDGGSSSD